jgi:hypothetical protein
MSFLVKTNNPILEPVSDYMRQELNVGGQKLNVQIHPEEGVSPFGRSVSNAINEMTFNLGSYNCAWLVPETSLSFDLSIGTTGAIPGSVDAVFDRVRLVHQSGNTILDEQAQNVFSRIKQIALMSTENANANWEEGLQNLMLADASIDPITPTAKRFNIKFRQSFWDQVKVIPLPILGNCRLILTQARDAQAFTYFTGSYTVANPVLNVSMLPYEMSYLERLKKVAQAGGLVLHYIQTQWVNKSVANAGINTVPIQFAVKNARSVVAVHRLLANETSATLEKLGKYQIPSNDNTQAFEIYCQQGGVQYPSSKITSFVEAYRQMKQVFKVDGDLDYGNQITRSLYSAANNTTTTNNASLAPRFIVAIDLTRGGNAGISTKDGPLEYVLNQALAVSGLSVDLFLQYDYYLVIKNPAEIYPDF